MFMFMLLLFLSIVLMLFLSILNYFLMDTIVTLREESTSYECGFEHNSLSRVPFSLRYFLLTIVFLIFDVEIMLLAFAPSFISSITLHMPILIVLMFLIVLFFGLVFEWYDGSLDWVM